MQICWRRKPLSRASRGHVKNWKHKFAGCCLAVFVQACSSKSPVAEEPLALQPINAQMQLETEWEVSIGGGVGEFFSMLTPAVGYGKYFAADREGQVYGFDAANGERLWRIDVLQHITDRQPGIMTQAQLSGGIALGRGKVFVGSEQGLVIALDEASGKMLWYQQVAGELLARPLVVEDKVIIHTSSGSVIALAEEDGHQVWSYYDSLPSLSLSGTSEPIYGRPLVLYGTADGKVNGLHIENGQRVWSKQIAFPQGINVLDRMNDIDAKVHLAGRILYTIGFHGHLAAIDTSNGHILWKKPYSSTKGLVIQGDAIIFVDAKDHMICVDANNGNERWNQHALQFRRVTVPQVLGGHVYVGDYEGYLHAFDISTGEIIARLKVDRYGFTGQPVVTEAQKLLLQSRNGNLSLISPKAIKQ